LVARLVGTAFIPPDDRGDFEINLKTPQGYTLARTDAAIRPIEREVQALPGVQHLTVTVGSPDTESVTAAQMVVVLKPIAERTLSQFDLMTQARAIVQRYPDLRTSVDQPPPMSGSGMRSAEIVYNIEGPDLGELERLARVQVRGREIAVREVAAEQEEVAARPGQQQVVRRVAVHVAGGVDLHIRHAADRGKRSERLGAAGVAVIDR